MEVDTLKNEMDAWIKDIRKEYQDFTGLSLIVKEHYGQLDNHNGRLNELRDEIEELKQEINALKLIQIIALKNRDLEEKKVKLV